MKELGQNRRIIDVVLIAGVIIGFIIVSVPVVSDVLATQAVTNTISRGDQNISSQPEEWKANLLANARKYNEYYTTDVNMDAQSILPYEEQLKCSEDGMMGWLEIDKINLVSTIYHGTDETSLASGAGHLEGTSLPVGGPGTHSVISAHSGSMTSRMFDDIRDLKSGDIVTLHVLGDELNYKVYGTEVFLPEEVQPHISVEQGRDLLTLLTCTPYGVNTHRLLVHAERTSETIEKDSFVEDIQESINSRTMPALIIAGIGAGVLIALEMARRRRRICRQT